MKLRRETKFNDIQTVMVEKFGEMNKNKDQKLKKGESCFKN